LLALSVILQNYDVVTSYASDSKVESVLLKTDVRFSDQSSFALPELEANIVAPVEGLEAKQELKPGEPAFVAPVVVQQMISDTAPTTRSNRGKLNSMKAVDDEPFLPVFVRGWVNIKPKSTPNKSPAVLSFLNSEFDKGVQNAGDKQQPATVAEKMKSHTPRFKYWELQSEQQIKQYFTSMAAKNAKKLKARSAAAPPPAEAAAEAEAQSDEDLPEEEDAEEV
jgi:hypothetical protein